MMNESENISGESIVGAALIRQRRLLTFLSQMRRLFEGGTSRAALIRVNTVMMNIRCRGLSPLQKMNAVLLGTGYCIWSVTI